MGETEPVPAVKSYELHFVKGKEFTVEPLEGVVNLEEARQAAIAQARSRKTSAKLVEIELGYRKVIGILR